MRHTILGVVYLTLVSSGAVAQTTICNRNGNTVYCDTPGPQSGPTAQDYLRAMPNTTEQMKAGSEYVNSIYDRQRQITAQRLRQQVGAMVASGQCQQARVTALNAGDFDLAGQVNSMCPGASRLPAPLQSA